MPAFCLVMGCGSNGMRDPHIRFFRVPSEKRRCHTIDELGKARRAEWVTAFKRSDITESKLKYGRVCSRHFHSGAPAALKDVDDPDWVPTKNMGHMPFRQVKRRSRFKDCSSIEPKRVIMSARRATCEAPVNIAVIKYWGKRDENLILPLNDSVSSTLSTEYMRTKTTIVASSSFKENKFWLNGKEETLDNQRILNCIQEIKKRVDPSLSEVVNWKIHICSENNFPTAAGLASSAAGYACLVFTLAALYDIKEDCSGIARLGSGSACRSMYGGWVQWFKGTDENGNDSIARQIAPESHWSEMRILVLVVNDTRKKYSSTGGMKRSVETSELLQYRVQEVVPKRLNAIIKAIQEKDFNTFAQITMQDSNQFHATCLDTYPPCVYMNDTSHAIVELIHAYNGYFNTNKIAYTFDAGPNACLYLLENDVSEFLSVLNYVFPPTLEGHIGYIKGIPVEMNRTSVSITSSLKLTLQQSGLLKYIIHTKVGHGPRLLTNPDDHLLTLNGIQK